IGWVMEGLEKGWLTKQQVGFDLKWGDVAGANRLLQMISRREGFGDLLAEGGKRASEKLGGEAAKAAVYTGKGASPRGHGHRACEDSLGICIFTTRTRLENVCRALSAATGWYYTVAEAMRFGRRTAAINRATALRCGLTPDLEQPSYRYGSTPHDGPAAGQAVGAQWEKMVDTWYREVGYDRKTGKPLPQT